MKKLIILLLFVAPFYCFAQTDTTQLNKNQEFVVVTFMGAGKNFELYVSDAATKKENAIEVKDDKGKDIKFTSLVLGLNYLEQKGWILIASTTAQANGFAAVTGAPTFIYKRNKDSKN